MSLGLLALLDDVAALTKASAGSLDDVAAATGHASAKAAGMAVDDTAMAPGFISGIEPADELRLVWRITLGSLRNKLVFLLPAALLLGAVAPWAVMPLLMLGGIYLGYEAAEKIAHSLGLGHKKAAQQTKSLDQRAKSAIQTDFILSAEIMSITLESVSAKPSWEQALVLGSVGLLMTLIVYGSVALIVKADDAGRALKQSDSGALRAVGRFVLAGMPVLMQVLTVVGTAAMAWVAGGIILRGVEALGWQAPGHLLHGWEAQAGSAGWLLKVCADAAIGLLVGAAAKLIADAARAMFGGANHE